MNPVLDPHMFKQAMRRLAGGVAVVTVGAGADRTGFTATSVTSLSADPPRLIVSLNRATSSWPVLNDYKSFGVNLLSSGQEAIADRFAGRGGEKGAARFFGSKWKTLVTGTPLLQDALAAIDCTVEEIIERHSHAIIIGRIEAVDLGPLADPLLYWSGAYHTINDLSPFLFSETA
jgi:flavin reductase (DIM6/NTAB) family NADH-FMN oxidoreductase RutF